MSPTPLHTVTGSRRRIGALMLVTTVWFAAVTVLPARSNGADPQGPGLTFSNPAGTHRTLVTAGAIDDGNPFFQSLGTNGRTCFTCHRPAQAWTITPGELRERFERTDGFDPIFRTNDGSNCEGADLSTLTARRQAFSLLMSRGLIRIGIAVPWGAEFEVIGVDDPYHCNGPLTSVSMYRRPLPTANLAFLSTVMWDGRTSRAGRSIRDDLMAQAAEAVTGHAQGTRPSRSELRAIVDFELGLITAQERDLVAGSLSQDGARGGRARSVDRSSASASTTRSASCQPSPAPAWRRPRGSIRTRSGCSTPGRTPRRRSAFRLRGARRSSIPASSSSTTCRASTEVRRIR